MENKDRPRIKLQMKSADWIMEITGLIFLVILLMITLVSYKIIPFDMAAYFDNSGNLDKYLNPYDLITYSVIGLIIYIIFTVQNNYLHKLPFPITVTNDNAERLYTTISRRLRILKVIFLLFILIHVIQKILVAQKIIQRSNNLFVLIFILIVIIIFYVSNDHMKKVK